MNSHSNRILRTLMAAAIIAVLFFGLGSMQRVQAQTPTPQTLLVANWSDPITLSGITGRPTVFFDGTTYHMWYTVTESGDLRYTSFTDPANVSAGTAVTGALLPGHQSSPAVLKDGSTFYMVNYTDATEKSFSLYTSTDGIAWTQGNVIFAGVGLPMDFQKIDAPSWIQDTSDYKLYFQVRAADGTYSLYVAASPTLDGTYSLANGNNPILTPGASGAWDTTRLQHPMVVKDGSNYYLWYVGYPSGGTQRLGFAFSSDGIIWTKGADSPILSGRAAEPSVVQAGGTWHLWYMAESAVIKYISASGPFQFSTIQAAVDAASAGDTVNVYPGNYTEIAADRYLFDNSGPYQFGLFIADEKSGITLQGVDTNGAVITAYADVVANVTTNATNNFGPSGVFVEGDDVTLSGLRILPNVGGDNKTIEVIGENFTLENSVIDVTGGGSVYLNDWRFDKTADESYLKSYAIRDNLFAQNASLDIASGAGYSGPVTGRVIEGNRFEYTVDGTWPAISFSGTSVVPWFTDPVNGATISGNTFVGTAQHIRARGAYDNATFDWLSYRANNTFEKTVVTFVGTTNEVRAFEYSTSYGAMTNVRRIGAAIQPEVDIALAGDTVDVSAGTFTEQVTISKDILLQGADGASVIQAYANMPVCFTTSYAHRPIVCVKDTANATIQGFTINGLGLGNTNNRFVGVAFRNAGGTIQDNTILDIRDTPFSGAQHGVGIYAYNDDATARSIQVLDNTLTGFQKTGIALNGSDTNRLTVSVQRNTVTGFGATSVTAQNGIQVWAPAGKGLVADNTITGIAYDNSVRNDGYVATSILNYYTNLNTTGNIISGAHMGIYYYDGRGLIANNDLTIEKVGVYAYAIEAADPPQAVPSPYDAPTAPAGISTPSGIDEPASALSPVEIANNTLTFSGADNTATYGIEADAGFDLNDLAVNIHHNSITGFDNGLVFYQCDQNCSSSVFDSITVVSNDLLDNTIAIYFYGPIPQDVIPVIHHNRIFGDVTTGSGLVNDSAIALTAENNWWGCNAGPADAACLGLTGPVDADPWLVLSFTADQTQLIPGAQINLTANLIRNSNGEDTSLLGRLLDGVPVDFTATYGSLGLNSTTLVGATATNTLAVPDPVNVTSATVSAVVDNQTVDILFGGRYYIFLPLIQR